MNKQTTKTDYSLEEAKKIIDSYIDESALRLQKKLNAQWKRQTRFSKKHLSYA